MDIVGILKDFGVPVAFAFMFWVQIKASQGSMQKQLDRKAEQDAKREARMADRIDKLETEFRDRLELIVENQQTTIRDATSAIRDNTNVMLGVKALLPKQP